jgi:hypothetical protein
MKQLQEQYGIDEFHHGDCIGSDKVAHDVIAELFPHTRIIIHPPLIRTKRAFCAGHEERPIRDYLIRNRYIVSETDALFATPKEMKEELRSGTWSTVRFARKVGGHVRILYPDGSIEE